jgi:hypothetical protein
MPSSTGIMGGHSHGAIRLLNTTVQAHGRISVAQISTIANITSSDTVLTHVALSSDHGSLRYKSDKNGEIHACSICSSTINLSSG